MSTETKVVSSIVLVTLLIIIGGIFAVSKKSSNDETKLTLKPELLQRADSPTIGSSTKVTIVEFADFECPSCAALHPTLQKLLQTDGDKFTLVYRNFPIHQHSVEAASAALAAGEQGKFWQMGDILFDRQDEWSIATANRTALFQRYATEIGLDLAKFNASVGDKKHADLVERDRQDGGAMGINSTPTLIINGKQALRGSVPYSQLRQLVLEAAGVTASTSATSTK